MREVHNVSVLDVDDRTEVSLHLKLPGSLTLAEAHEVAEAVEREILAAVPVVDAVQTHIEPLAEPAAVTSVPAGALESESEAVRGIVRDTTGSEPRELRFLATDRGLVAFLTLAMAPERALAEAHARASEIEERIRRDHPEIVDVIVHTEPSSGSGVAPSRRARQPRPVRRTVDDLLAEAQERIAPRLHPEEAERALASGALLIDLRSDDERRDTAVVPGSLHIPATCSSGASIRTPASRTRTSQASTVASSSSAAGVLLELRSREPARPGCTNATDMIGGFDPGRRRACPCARCPTDDRVDPELAIPREQRRLGKLHPGPPPLPANAGQTYYLARMVASNGCLIWWQRTCGLNYGDARHLRLDRPSCSARSASGNLARVRAPVILSPAKGTDVDGPPALEVVGRVE